MNYKTLNVFKSFRKKKKEIIKEIQINDTVCLMQFSTYTHYEKMATLMGLNNWAKGDSLYQEEARRDFVNEFTVVDIQPHIEAPHIALCGIRNNITNKEYIVNLRCLVKIVAKQETYKFQIGQNVHVKDSSVFHHYDKMAQMMNLKNYVHGKPLFRNQTNSYIIVANNKHESFSDMKICGIRCPETNYEYIVNESNLEG